MSLRPKTKRRLLQLGGSGLALAALTTAAATVQLHRHELARQHLRAQGMAAFDRGDYPHALNDLQKYLSDNRADPQALYTLAEARCRVPLPEQAHLTAARQMLVRYLASNKGDPAAQHLLLDVYQKLQFRNESLALADQILAGSPDDPPALAVRWQELAREGRLDQALATALHLDGVDPTDVVAQEATLELMSRLGRPPAELTGRAGGLLERHPDDPRFELVRAVAAHLTGDAAGTRRWLAAAAARPSPDAAFTLTLANAFDRTGQWADAVDLLDRAAGPNAPPPLRAAAAERLWYAGRIDRALSHLTAVTPADPAADPGLLGLQAVLLDGAAGPTDALVAPPALDPPADPPAVAAILAALSARGGDPAAAAASALVRGTDPARPVDPGEAVTLTAAAARTAPASAPARFFLGRAYLRRGERGLAMELLAGAATLAPAWAAPRLLLARALLDADQPTAAEAPARAALDRDPGSTAAAAVLAVVAYRTLSPRAAAARIAPVLAAVRSAAAADPADPRLPAAAVDLLARSGRRADATAAALDYLTGPAATAAGVYRVAAVAAADHLDVTAAVVAHAADQSVTPDAALDAALALAAVGRADAGRRQLADAVAGHTDDPDWQLAALRYREATTPDSPGLGQAWAVLADANRKDLAVQRAALRSPAVGRLPPLVDAVIDRVKALTGDDAVEWRLARARAQLADPAGGRAAADAVESSMAEVSRVVPRLAEPLVLWATAAERAGDGPTAVERMRTAVSLAPDDPSLPLRLAGLLARSGQFRPAADAVAPLARRAADLPPAVAIDVADVYRLAGQPERAVDVLLAARRPGPDAPADVALAEVALAESQAAAGRAAAAAATFDRLNGSAAATADSVRAAAWFHAAAGDVPRGRRTLARLAALPAVAPVQRDVIAGQFDAAFGDPAAARSALAAATRHWPDDPRSWAALAGFDLHADDPAGAVAAATAGLKLVPDNAALSALSARARAVVPLHLDVADQPLLDALAADPANPAAVATLDAVVAGTPVADVAGQHPAFAPALALAVEELLTAGRFDAAADLAARSAAAAPSDPAPERLLDRVWTTAGRPDQALVAAQEWRDRSRAAPRSADVAIADADLRLGRPGPAVSQLAPYVTTGTADDHTAEAYARALATAGRAADADAVLRPRAAASADVRRAWLSTIADTAPTAADAARRIGTVTPLLAAGSVDDRVAVAAAWYTVAARFADDTAARRGLASLAPLADVAAVPPDARVLAGALHQQLGDLPAAEADYRRAVDADPSMARGLNNLAWVITLRGGDPAEARRDAERAVAIVPADADLRVTLGQVALRQNDVAAADDAFRTAARLAPRSAAAWAGLADAAARAGHTGDAADALDRADRLLAPPAPPPSPATADALRRARAALGRPDPAARTDHPVG